jgi:hypothetical protein
MAVIKIDKGVAEFIECNCDKCTFIVNVLDHIPTGVCYNRCNKYKEISPRI